MPRPRSNSKLETSLPRHSAATAGNQKLAAALLRWFVAHARDLPRRRTRDPYAIWVSEIMLQQTQVKTVIPYWERWMRELPDIAALARARSEKIHKLWEGLGYYTRVRNMQKAARQIVACRRRGNETRTRKGSEPPHPPSSSFGAASVVSHKFPENFDDVLALPGVGRYTAGAICSIAFNQPTPILDGNVIRVLARVFGISGNPKEKKTNARLWQLAADLVSHAKDAKDAKIGKTIPLRSLRPLREANSRSFLNQSLMELGALICTPRQPKCAICPVKKLCVARREQRVEELPNLGKRVAATARRFTAFIVERDGKFLVQQRSAGMVNAHLWEFPNVEVPVRSPAFRRLGNTAATDRLKAELQASLPFCLAKNARPFCRLTHSITRYRITLEAFRAGLAGPPPRDGKTTRWLKLAGLEQLPFTSAHRKILAKLRVSASMLESKL